MIVSGARPRRASRTASLKSLLAALHPKQLANVRPHGQGQWRPTSAALIRSSSSSVGGAGGGSPGVASARQAASNALGSGASVTACGPSSRASVTSTLSPAAWLASSAASIETESTAAPSKSGTRSPGSTPASAAGDPGKTWNTVTPSPVFFAGTIPSHAPAPLPPVSSVSTTSRARLLGSAKPGPPPGPSVPITHELMPTTSPSRSSSGPPELPIVIAASVWMNRGPAPFGPRRPTALTIPCVIEPCRPNGLPSASTIDPVRRRAESPQRSGVVSAGKSSGAMPSTATSTSAS